MSNPTPDVSEVRRRKLESLRAAGINPFPNGFKPTHDVSDLRAAIEATPGTLSEAAPVFTVAGRIMAINRFGKAAFIRLRDRTGQIQAYLRKDRVGEAAYDLFKQIDIGDFVGIAGGLFQTRSGEWTLMAQRFELVTKSIRALPEKFHGLKDPEKRYRQRYLDLVMNAEVRDLFRRRSGIIQEIRDFLRQRDFLEVETPMMQPVPGGAEATPFVTHHNALDMPLYLRIAPELYLKRLVVGGFERVFEINRNFRNEGISTRHNPEFTMLEFYQAYATYQDLMSLTETMFRQVAQRVTGAAAFVYQGQSIDFAPPWRRIGLYEALEEIAGIDRRDLEDRDKLIAIAAQRGVQLTRTGQTAKIITKLFDVLVEPLLIQPTFVTGYPVAVSPLSRRSDTVSDLTERFELFIAGYEIANGFSELNDPEDQQRRFAEQVAEREAGDAEAHPMDLDYIEALEYGMPPTAGEGVGIDRLTMLLSDAASIREVILFPHLKPRE
ncbi:MAG: lysine--tRNA ligase [Desulfobacterales bacterium]|jgi:lysyl-tRNA synthetase class 2|nr:lysine--tRNA ligase [Desulfobacterales bacterium]